MLERARNKLLAEIGRQLQTLESDRQHLLAAADPGVYARSFHRSMASGPSEQREKAMSLLREIPAYQRGRWRYWLREQAAGDRELHAAVLEAEATAWGAVRQNVDAKRQRRQG